MCEYKSDYAMQTEIRKIITEEKGIEVSFKEVEQKLAEKRFGYVAVFCRNVGISGSWEIIVVDDDKKQLRRAKAELLKDKGEPVELVFIIKSNSRFVQSKIKYSFNSRSGYTSRPSPLLCQVSH